MMVVRDGCWDGILMTRFSAFIKETPKGSLLFIQLEDLERMPSVYQDVSSHQTPNLLSTLTLDSQFLEL